MREVLKTSISKYGPKTNAAITVENVQGKGLQLAIIYAGRKYYLPLSSVPLNPDEHANHPNHQKIKVDHNGSVGIGTPTPTEKLHLYGTSNMDIRMEMVADADVNRIQFYRAKAGPAVVTDNQDLGAITAYGHDDTDYEVSSQILFEIDDTASNNVMPGRITFHTTTTDGTVERMRIDSAGNVSLTGPLTGTRLAKTNLANDGEIPITATCVDIDANGSARTGIRFAGTGTAGQIIIVNNTGGEKLTFHATAGTCLVRGMTTSLDTMESLGVYMFVSDGALWNLIGGGSLPNEGLTAS